MATRAETDKKLVGSGGIIVQLGQSQGPGLIGFALNAAASIRFQFPPKITSDGRKHSWTEKEVPREEPIAIPNSGSGRSITLAFSYINDGIDGWNAELISAELRKIRGYFVKFAGAGLAGAGRGEALTVKLRLFGVGGQSLGTFRSKGCDMKYSETLIYEASNPKLAFPYRTDVTLDLVSWFKKTQFGTEDDATDFNARDDQYKGQTPEEWY